MTLKHILKTHKKSAVKGMQQWNPVLKSRNWETGEPTWATDLWPMHKAQYVVWTAGVTVQEVGPIFCTEHYKILLELSLTYLTIVRFTGIFIDLYLHLLIAMQGQYFFLLLLFYMWEIQRQKE